MSSLVLGVAASHTTLMNTHWHELRHLDRAERFRNALGQASGTPEGPQRVDTDLARHIVAHVLDNDFDVAFSAKLQVDHGITHAIQYITAGLDVPIVPIVINVFAPPLPPFPRCGNGGQEIRSWVALAAACGHPRGSVLAYEEIPEWLTGMAVAILDPIKEQQRDG